MRRSHPTSFVIKKRDSCAVCNNIAPCPACPAGQQCQQIFRSSCQDCPVNKCVPIPGYTAHNSSNSSALGGGLAALFIVAIAAGVGFWFWKRLQAKRRRALHEEAMERREKLRNEKETMTLQLGAKKSDPNSFAIIDEDELDNDTEYTQVTGGVLNNDKDGLGSLAEPTAFRRRSFGAATHLSRITEGAEEEEDDAMSQAGAGANGKRNTVGSVQSNSKSFASGAGPRVSIGSGTSFGSHNIIPIAFKPYTPSTHSGAADDAANEGSLADYQSISPLVLPSTAHRATGAPAIQVNTSRQGPVRPTRAPDLNLRLPDSNRPHQPTTSSPLATSQPNPASNAYEFMSIDPVETLKSSSAHPYSPSNRPLSGATINTINSTHSTSLSYVLSAPQVITPVSAEGVRRVQLGNGGKAQLVKVPSVKRKPAPAADPFRDPTEGDEDGELAPPPSNRFGGDRSSTHSTSTLGIPFGENPFGTIQPPADQTSPSDAEERSSWLTSKDPFQDPRPSDAVGEEEPRVSIGGLSLLGQFPFDFSREEEKLPGDALSRVEQFK